MSSPVRSGSQKANDTLGFLRSKILSGEWPIDELIPKEPELMELIGVGKSTVREAVRSLATLGMLQTVPGVGTFVRARTPASSILTQFLADQDLEEVLVYRRSLEIEAAQTAAVRRSESQLDAIRESYRLSVEAHEQHAEAIACNNVSHEHSLHRLIVEASGSKLLLDLYNGVMATQRSRGPRPGLRRRHRTNCAARPRRAPTRDRETRRERRGARHGATRRSRPRASHR